MTNTDVAFPPYCRSCPCDRHDLYLPSIPASLQTLDMSLPNVACLEHVLCNRHWFNRVPGAPPRDGLGVTYLPSTISSDAGYADLPLALLGAPVSIGALVKLGSRSLAKQDRDWSSRPPGQDYMYPFGVIGVAPRYIPARAVIELA